MDAALKVIARTDYTDVPVSDVLAEAGLSTRAFYRHFATKDDLVLAMFRRDAEAVGGYLQAIVDSAPTCIAALDAWVDGVLDLYYEPRRAARVRMFTAVAVRRADGYDEELVLSKGLLRRSLVDALERGTDSGVLTSDDPANDAETILAVTSAAAGPPAERRFSTRTEARSHIVRFCWPALGLKGSPS